MSNMRDADAEIRRRNKAEAEKKQADALLNDFCNSPTMFNLGRRTCSRAVGKRIIEHGLVLAQGYGYYAKIKPLGCGVYHVTYEQA